MTDTEVAISTSPAELLATGRRHLAVRDFSAAVEALANACELLAKEHGDMADQCAEAYLWYGKSLLGLSREESGVLGDGMPGGGANAEEEDDDDQEENGDEEAENGEAEAAENGKPEAVENKDSASKENGVAEKTEPESTSKDDEPSSSKPQDADEEPGANGDANDESVANLENEDDVDNLQLAWEMLDLSRSILEARVQDGGGAAARALLADAHLALGEVALESETYDKAVGDMQCCLELQKELYRSDDRRIAETHYQIGLANSLASNFEEAITHFKNAANILETRIKTLENPQQASEDETVKKYTTSYTIQGEIKELKELLPEIQEKIQDMMDYKAETIRRVRETLCPSNGAGAGSSGAPASAPAPALAPAPAPALSSGSGSSGASSSAKPVTNISHLVKRKRKASEEGDASVAKKANT